MRTPALVKWTIYGVAGLSLAMASVAALVHAEDAADGDEVPKVTSVDDPFTQNGQDVIHRATFGRQHTPTPLLIPDQDIPVRFSHRLHVAPDGDLDCGDCHASDFGAPMESSVRSSDVNLPTDAHPDGEGCFDCHDVDEPVVDAGEPPGACTTCHPGYDPAYPADADSKADTSLADSTPFRSVLPKPFLKFNHKAHLDKDIDCATCHGTMSDVDFATRENALPVMGKCLECHDGDQAPKECSTCHLTLPSGLIDTNATSTGQPLMPSGWYHDDAHDEDWIHSHRNSGQVDDAYCSNCHEPKYCVDCHNGVQKPLKFHPNNWVLQHTQAARRNSPDCQSCHRTQTFCMDCHRQSGVLNFAHPGGGGEDPDYASSQPNHLKFHPEGWVSYSTRGENHHAFQAQRNIRACTSCHTERTCTKCHATSGMSGQNINPHPPGFVSRCANLYRRNPRVCAKCHVVNGLEDADIERCR